MQDLERQNNILKYLEKHRSATVEFLSKTFYASPSTIRRDLTTLENTGMVHRTHGGVIYDDKIKELSIYIRKNKNEDIKNRLAEEAIKHIPEFTTIYVDNSTTCLPLMKLLQLDKKVVVTNSVLNGTEAQNNYQLKLIFVGGEFDVSHMSTSGPEANEFLTNFHFDIMFQSCAFINKDGAYENEYSTAAHKKTARSLADFKVLIFDRSKLEHSAGCKCANLSDFDLIVCNITEEEKATLLEKNPNLNIVTIK